MNQLALQPCTSARCVDEIDRWLTPMSAAGRVDWALSHLPGAFILSSSFGIQSAVMLHLAVRRAPELPVVLVDTGYLFPETYHFIDRMTERLKLNLQVFRPAVSAVWQEARYGRLWEQGVDGIRRYNQMNKVEPMQRALQQLKVNTWFSGRRREQSRSRADLPFAEAHGDIYKINPIADWSNRDVHRYLKLHDLPYHPLWESGYLSVGDSHSSRPISAGMLEEESRFNGLLRECGLHEPERYSE